MCILGKMRVEEPKPMVKTTTKLTLRRFNVILGQRNSVPVPKMTFLLRTEFANFEKCKIWPKKCISELPFDFNGEISPKVEISKQFDTNQTPSKAVIQKSLNSQTILDKNIVDKCQNQCKFVTFFEFQSSVFSSKIEIMSNFELVQVAWVRDC